MAEGAYKLDLDGQKRNIFVTQLHQRDDEEDDVQAFPIVKESAAKLLETGLNTLQKTLLLKKEVEVDQVDEELREKRAEFQTRMEKCAQKQIEIQKRQQKMKDRVSKFEKFIKENEAKRRRAIQKYQQEVRLREQKQREYEQLQEQLAILKTRNDLLKHKLAMYEKFKDYLLAVVDILPTNYLEVQDSMVNALIMRHRTLSDTSTTLLENLIQMGDKLDAARQEYKEYQQEHNKMKLAINSELSEKQKAQDVLLNRNDQQDAMFMMNKIQIRARNAEEGQILLAIDNLAEKCRRKLDPTLDELSTEDKLVMIKKYIMDQLGVATIAQQESTSHTIDQKSSTQPLKPALKAK